MTEPDHQSAFRAAARWTTRAVKGTVTGIGIGLSVVTGAFALQTAHQELRLNNTMQFVVAPPTTPTPTAHDLSFGPFTEAADRRINAGLALKPAPNNQTTAYAMLSEMGSSHYAIMRNAVVLDSQMVACRMTPDNCSPALDKFRQLIDTARTISDPTTKALLVNAWVNTAIVYDDGLVQSQKTSNPRPVPDMVETLATGKGICDQQAQLKLYALSRSGIPQQDLRFVALMVVKDGKWAEAHAVVLARLNGKAFALNNQQYGRDFPGQDRASDNQRLNYNAILHNPRSLLNIDYDAPFRQGGASLLPLYSANYVSAQPYQGMMDGEKPPYYRGTAFKRHMLSPSAPMTAATTLTAEQQLGVSNTLADALHFQDNRQSTLILPTMTINAATMKAAAAQRPKDTAAHAAKTAPEF